VQAAINARPGLRAIQVVIVLFPSVRTLKARRRGRPGRGPARCILLTSPSTVIMQTDGDGGSSPRMVAS
jgi:hypothetical protein